MAGAQQNLEKGAQGGDIVLDVYFREYAGGPLVDSDSLPTYEIFNPSSVSQETGSGTKVSIGYYQVTYSIPLAAPIGTTWRIEWEATINGSTITGQEYFTVVAVGSIGFGHSVTISDAFLYQIKKVLAYPSLDNIVLSDDQIKSLCVFPALHDYFRKFPIEVTEQYTINGQFEQDFPDTDTFGVVDTRIVDKGGVSGTGENSFWNLYLWNQISGKGSFNSGDYGTKYNFNGNRQQNFLQRNVGRSIENLGTYKYFINYKDRQVEAYSSADAKIDITWAKTSSDFDDVRYVYQFDVIKLAQAYLLEHFADTSGLVTDTGAELAVDVDSVRTKANDLKTEIMDKWNEIPSVILMKGD